MQHLQNGEGRSAAAGYFESQISVFFFFKLLLHGMWDILNSKTHTDQQPEVPRNVEYGSLLRSDSSEMEVNKSLLEGL